MLKLNVITVSTRPTRIGPVIANWFVEYASNEFKDIFDVKNIFTFLYNKDKFHL